MTPGWVERFFRWLYPHYRYRFEIYNDVLLESLTSEKVWLDLGCGRNEQVGEFGARAMFALGIDSTGHSEQSDAPFLQADLRHLPLQSDYADVISMRMVVEHIERIPDDLMDTCRVLKPGGKLIILTTNNLSPIVFLPRILPYALKQWLIVKLFRVSSRDVFPTYHAFNSATAFKGGLPGMCLKRLEFIEQLSFARPAFAILFGAWYSLVRIPSLKYLRSNILAVFEKTENDQATLPNLVAP